jgi:putative peptide zinc metalloprotease protein
MLPLLREELALLPGPVLADGQPSHTLHDPVRNLFFQVDWPTFEVLRRWHLGHPAAIAHAVSEETALQLDSQDVEGVVDFFRDNQLLRPAAGSAATLAQRLQARHGSVWQRLLHHYLFFRIPLLHPDRWLGRWAPRLGLFYSQAFLFLTLAALAWGLVEVYRQWGTFAATLVDTFSPRGLAAYGATLVFTKLLHELGHAVTAKRLGCKVPTMGVAFLVMCPVAYTDTNDVWKLTDRRQRLAVAGAGVLTELALAAWATAAWAWLPAGTPRSIAFLLATTTWVSTIAVNASPFMRFDGYFLLSDWLEMPNLHARAFALARWALRERLFGLGHPPPEGLPARRRIGLIAFAYVTWAYRLGVFLGIAALVYTFFIKAVGILLFGVEVCWFVLLPLLREVKAWAALWPELRHRSRAWHSAAWSAALVALLFVPWPSRPAASALLRPASQTVIYAPPSAQVAALPVAEGQRVKAGDALVRFTSPELASRLAAAAARVQSLRWQASASTLDATRRAQWQTLQDQLREAEAELTAVQADAARYAPVAPFDGVLRDIEPDITPGTWLSAGEPVARLVADQEEVAVAYLDDDAISRIAVGDHATFYSDAPGGPVVALQVTSVDADATRALPEPELATVFGGRVAAREHAGQFHPDRPVYRVSLKAIDPPRSAARHTWRGTVVVSGRAAAPAWRYLRGIAAVIQREAGF